MKALRISKIRSFAALFALSAALGFFALPGQARELKAQWAGPKARLLAAYPGLKPLGANLRSDDRVQSLARMLALAMPAEIDSRKQAVLIQTAVYAHAWKLIKESELLAKSEPSLEDIPAVLTKLRALDNQMGDICFNAAGIIPAKYKERIVAALFAARSKVVEAYDHNGSRLVSAHARRLENGDVSWLGRTARLELAGGEVLAFKRQEERGIEDWAMRKAARFGIETPLELPPSKAADKTYLPYLTPRLEAKDYFSYLSDKLPENLNRKQKADRIEKAALKGIEHLSLLHANGYAHGSLIPLSHSKAHWEWDYWRWTPAATAIFLGGIRYGPSSLHNWASSLKYPNLRLSGLADWEHLALLGSFVRAHDHDSAELEFRHDQFSIVGQNLTEWALVVLDAAAANGISPARAAGILAQGFGRHAQILLTEDQTKSINWRTVRYFLKASSRKFLLFSAAAKMLSSRLSDRLNRIFSKNPIFEFAIPVAKGESVVMPGEILQPLLWDVVNPYVALLRKAHSRDAAAYNNDPMYLWEKAGHDFFGSRLRGTKVAVFLTSICAAFRASFIFSIITVVPFMLLRAWFAGIGPAIFFIGPAFFFGAILLRAIFSLPALLRRRFTPAFPIEASRRSRP